MLQPALTSWTRNFLKPDNSAFPKFHSYGKPKIEVPASWVFAGFGQWYLNAKPQNQSWRQEHEDKFSSVLGTGLQHFDSDSLWLSIGTAPTGEGESITTRKQPAIWWP